MCCSLLYLSKLDRNLRQLKNSRCYTEYRMKNLYNLCIALQKSYRQHTLWLKPDSSQNYSSSKHMCFSCMLSIMKYMNRLNMKSLSPSSIHNYSSSKHMCFSCMLSIMKYLNRLSMMSLSPSSSPNYKTNRRQLFSCMLSIMKYLNRLSMKSLSPDSIQNYRSCRHLRFGYSYCNQLFANN